MTPRHDVETHPRGTPAQSWSPTESIPLPAPKPARTRSFWLLAVLYPTPLLVITVWAWWELVVHGFPRALWITAGAFTFALLIALTACLVDFLGDNR